MIVRNEIEKLAQEAADGLGYMIYETVIYLKGENSKITVKIDRLEGVSHRDCEIFSKRLDELITGSGLLAKYMLEISSPGLNRRLRTLDEIRRFQGEPVKIIGTVNGVQQALKGTVTSINDDVIELHSENAFIQIKYCNIKDAYLDY